MNLGRCETIRGMLGSMRFQCNVFRWLLALSFWRRNRTFHVTIYVYFCCLPTVCFKDFINGAFTGQWRSEILNFPIAACAVRRLLLRIWIVPLNWCFCSVIQRSVLLTGVLTLNSLVRHHVFTRRKHRKT